MDHKLAVVSLITAAILALASSVPVVEGVPEDETENSPMMTLDRTNGKETYQTDEEAARTLEMAKRYKSSELYNIPEDPSEETPDKTKRDVIGRDSRYRINSASSSPLCAIGQLSYSSGVGYCTVYMIGRHHAITAGHCVYNTTTKSYYRNLDVYIGRTCNQRGIHADVLSISLYTAYKNLGDRRYDIAFLLLDSRDISSSCYLGFAYRDPMTIVNASVCGYPYDKTYWYHSYSCMYCSDGKAAVPCRFVNFEIVCEDRYIIHSSDTYAGMTGGPLLTNEHFRTRNVYLAYGVNSGTFTICATRHNRATRFTKKKFADICLWLRNNRGVCNAVLDLSG